MKFKSIDTSKSRKGSITVKTDPPMSQPLLDRVKGCLQHGMKIENGLLLIEGTHLGKEDIAYYEGAFTNSERNITKEHTQSEADRKKWLDDLSDESGLSLE